MYGSSKVTKSGKKKTVQLTSVCGFLLFSFPFVWFATFYRLELENHTEPKLVKIESELSQVRVQENLTIMMLFEIKKKKSVD